MKRINPNTGVRFKYGDIREDGRKFQGYAAKVKTDGFQGETWLTPEKWEANKFKSNERIKNSRKKDPERMRARDRALYEKNAERSRQTDRDWCKANPEKIAAKQAKRRASKLQRTPSWLTREHHLQIEGFYMLAKAMEKQLNGKYEVDHIEPLNGKEISGFHVPWNLQVLPKEVNNKKSNKRVY